MLLRICVMKDEITQFFRDQKKVRRLSLFENKSLCYLTDIFERLNVFEFILTRKGQQYHGLHG